MDGFSILWILIIIGFVFVPALIDKKLKEAMKNVSPKTPPVFPAAQERQERERALRPSVTLPAQEEALPLEGESVIAAAAVKEKPKPPSPSKKFVVNPEYMVIYSAIMKPKFEED